MATCQWQMKDLYKNFQFIQIKGLCPFIVSYRKLKE
mgnify:CR=1 FL=1